MGPARGWAQWRLWWRTLRPATPAPARATRDRHARPDSPSLLDTYCFLRAITRIQISCNYAGNCTRRVLMRMITSTQKSHVTVNAGRAADIDASLLLRHTFALGPTGKPLWWPCRRSQEAADARVWCGDSHAQPINVSGGSSGPLAPPPPANAGPRICPQTCPRPSPPAAPAVCTDPAAAQHPLAQGCLGCVRLATPRLPDPAAAPRDGVPCHMSKRTESDNVAIPPLPPFVFVPAKRYVFRGLSR